jgi:hypothetical protein
MSTLPHVMEKLTELRSFNACQSLFFAFLRDSNAEFSTKIRESLNNASFRSWFIVNVLAPAGMAYPSSFILASKISLTESEFTAMIPALRKVLPEGIGPLAVRAAALRFIAAYPTYEPALTRFSVQTALSILLHGKRPAFPEIRDYPETLPFDRALPLVNPPNAQSLELEASLHVLSRSIANGIDEITLGDLNRIHANLAPCRDPRVRKPYLKFLSALGLRGIAYAAQISQIVENNVIPFF